jgi:hypothetical protein
MERQRFIAMSNVIDFRAHAVGTNVDNTMAKRAIAHAYAAVELLSSEAKSSIGKLDTLLDNIDAVLDQLPASEATTVLRRQRRRLSLQLGDARARAAREPSVRWLADRDRS